MKAKYIILVTHKRTGLIEPYNNLKSFINAYKMYSYNTLSNYITRQGVAFEDDIVKVEKKEVIK